jgi:hypothetical protein
LLNIVPPFFNIWTPGANTNGGVSVFRRTEGGRNLELVVNDQTLQNRTSFIFV